MQLEVAKTRLQIFSRITQSLQFVILFSAGSLNLRGNMLIKYIKSVNVTMTRMPMFMFP